MKLASIRDAEIRCSLPVLLLLPAMAANGRLCSNHIGSFSLIHHVLAHAMTAERLGCRIASIELQPFGCVARLVHQPTSPSENAAIAAAGPLISLLLSLGAVGMGRLFPESASGLEGFISFNLGIAVMNLFPVLPLDGGRLLESILTKHMGRQRAIRLLTMAGCIFGSGLAILGALLISIDSSFDFSSIMPIITGCFILISAITERRRLGTDRMRLRLNADTKLRQGGALPVSAIAMNERATVREALAALSSSGYNLVLIVDGNLHNRGFISESELISAAMRGAAEQKIGTFLPRAF